MISPPCLLCKFLQEHLKQKALFNQEMGSYHFILLLGALFEFQVLKTEKELVLCSFFSVQNKTITTKNTKGKTWNHEMDFLIEIQP